MLPADELEHPPAMRYKNRFVADGSEIPRPVAVKELIDLIGSGRSHKPGNGGVCFLFVPAIHGFNEGFPGLMSRRDHTLVHRRHSPTAIMLFHRLRVLELIERPEYRQPAIGVR